jgi:hypothetical protein
MTDETRPTFTVLRSDSASDSPQHNQDHLGVDQVMDALAAAARMADCQQGTVMDTNSGSKEAYKPLSDDEVQDLIRTVRSFLNAQEDLPRKERITSTQIARAIGEAASTVSQVLNNAYPEGKGVPWAKRDSVLGKLSKFLATEKARRAAPQRTPFAWIKVAEEILTVAKTAVHHEGIGVVTGSAGIGKSMTLTALLDKFPGSVLITIDDGTHSVPSFLRELCTRLKAPAMSYSRQSLWNAARAALTGTGRLLIVDEAHLAGAAVLNCLRQLTDATGCPALLCGLPALRKMLMRGRGDDSRGATLYSRIVISRDLEERCRGGNGGEPLYSVEDIKKIFARSQLRLTADATEWVSDLANLPDTGGLRACNNALRLAIRIARAPGQPAATAITANMLAKASELLHGIEGAKVITARIKQRRAAAGA